jgi:hypothetical protein
MEYERDGNGRSLGSEMTLGWVGKPRWEGTAAWQRVLWLAGGVAACSGAVKVRRCRVTLCALGLTSLRLVMILLLPSGKSRLKSGECGLFHSEEKLPG